MSNSAEAGGFEPPVRLPVRQFSKLLVSATHPNFLKSDAKLERRCVLNAGAKVMNISLTAKLFIRFFE